MAKKVNASQIMEKIVEVLPQLNEEGMKIAQYNLHKFQQDSKVLSAKEAKELYFDLIQNYQAEDEVEWDDEDDDEVTLDENEEQLILKGIEARIENSLKKNTKGAKSKEDEAVDKLVSIVEGKEKPKKSNLKTNHKGANETKPLKPQTETKPKQQPKKTGDVVYDVAPTPEEIVKLVGYRYSYPKFPLEFNCKALNNRKLINRGDIETIAEFKAIENAMYEENESNDNFVIAVYVKEEDIVDSRMYDWCNMYPNSSFKTMLKPFGIEHFPQELDILKIVDISEKAIMAKSMYTDIPYVFTHNRFKNHPKLHCRANFMGLDYQIYQVQY